MTTYDGFGKERHHALRGVGLGAGAALVFLAALAGYGVLKPKAPDAHQNSVAAAEATLLPNQAPMGDTESLDSPDGEHIVGVAANYNPLDRRDPSTREGRQAIANMEAAEAEVAQYHVAVDEANRNGIPFPQR